MRAADIGTNRVVQLNAADLLWVQVRCDSEHTAHQVLESVRTQGSLG